MIFLICVLFAATSAVSATPVMLDTYWEGRAPPSSVSRKACQTDPFVDVDWESHDVYICCDGIHPSPNWSHVGMSSFSSILLLFLPTDCACMAWSQINLGTPKSYLL